MKSAFIKVFRDIWAYKARSLLLLAGILIGITATGSVFAAYAILDREMNRNYMETNPASIVIYSGDLTPDAVENLKSTYPGTSIALRKTVTGRLDNGDGTYGIISLRTVEDFSNLQVDTFTLENGSFPKNPYELAIERDSFKILKNLKGLPGETIKVSIPGSSGQTMTISAVIHAPGLAPASMEHFSYGFLRLEDLQRMGIKGWYDEIRIVSYDERFDRQKMKNLAEGISGTLEKAGCSVDKIDVPVPGRHPHASQLDSILFLLQAFALVSLLAACLIIINLLNFILSMQSRQIAIMKSVGATTGQIAAPYFMFIVLMGLAGLALSIPASMACGAAYSDFAAEILNFKIFSYHVPFWVFAVQSLVGILLPVLAAFYPILKNCMKTVNDGLCDTVGRNSSKKRMRAGLLRKVHSGILFRFSAANLGRKKTRTLLAILALAMGGMLFMSAQNIAASVRKTVDESFNAKKWDYDIRLVGVYDEPKLTKVLSEIEGLSGFSIWEGGMVRFAGPGSDAFTSYRIRIMPDNANMDGSSANLGTNVTDERTIQVNKLLANEQPWVKTGVAASLKAGGKAADFIISDIVNEVPGIAPTVYINQSTYEGIFGHGTNQAVLGSAASKDKSRQLETLKDIEKRFADAGITISESWTLYLLRKAFIDHLYVILTLLGVIAMLAVVVGGISIASAIGISISERKREIGIMRATGAKGKQTLFIVLLEAVMMGFSGWLLGVLLSIPVSGNIGNYFGNIFLQSDLINRISLSGTLIWLALSLTVSAISGLLPANQASRASLRDMLAYE